MRAQPDEPLVMTIELLSNPNEARGQEGERAITKTG